MLSVSMDGLRSNLTNDLRKLRDIVKSISDGENFDSRELVEYTDLVIQWSNSLNCIFIDSDENFNDISHKSVEPINQD